MSTLGLLSLPLSLPMSLMNPFLLPFGSIINIVILVLFFQNRTRDFFGI